MPEGASIELHIAKITALNRNRQNDPLLFITGGPGQAASESWPGIQHAFHHIAKHRDVYILDQRGTGLSNKLDCPTGEQDIDVFVFDEELTAELARQCLDALPGDPRFYTTSVAVQDIEKLRLDLGIDQWNIYGVSYGTRVALHYLRRYPKAVRTLVLDAAVPPGTPLGPGIALEAEKALQQLFDRCEQDSACSEAYPDLQTGTRSVLQELRGSPVDIEYENFKQGSVNSTRLTANHVTLTMRMLTYSTYGVAILPNMLKEAYANRNFAPFARQAAMQSETLGESLASGMHNAIICTEDNPEAALGQIDLAELANTYLGETPLKALRASCKQWPAGLIDDDFHQPIKSDMEVLVLSGGADPATPPTYGDEVARHMPNALHIVNPHQGHVQIGLGCMPRVVANFISRGKTRDVDFGCLERLRAEPFFIDANGPRP